VNDGDFLRPHRHLKRWPGMATRSGWVRAI